MQYPSLLVVLPCNNVFDVKYSDVYACGVCDVCVCMCVCLCVSCTLLCFRVHVWCVHVHFCTHVCLGACSAYLSCCISSARFSLSSQVILSSAMIFSVSYKAKHLAHKHTPNTIYVTLSFSSANSLVITWPGSCWRLASPASPIIKLTLCMPKPCNKTSGSLVP